MPLYNMKLELGDESGESIARFDVDIDYDYLPGTRGYADPMRGVYEPPSEPEVDVGKMTIRLDDGTAPPLVVQTWIEERLRASSLMTRAVESMAEEGGEEYVSAAEMRAESRAEMMREAE